MKTHTTEWEKTFANNSTNKGLTFKIYKQLMQLNIKSNPTKKWEEYLYRHFYNEDVQMEKKYTKGCSKPPNIQFSCSFVSDSATPWTAARWASLSITNSQSLLKLMFIESVMPSNHLILCCPLLLPPSIFPSITIFYSESVLCIRWPKY